MPSDLDSDITPETVTGYLKSRGYSDDLAGRLAQNVLANPFGSGNYDHVAGTRKWLDAKADPVSFPTQQDQDYNASSAQMGLLVGARSVGPATPTGLTLLGAASAQIPKPQFHWVAPKQKAQQVTAQSALAMVSSQGADPQIALDTASKLYSPLHRDSFLGVGSLDSPDGAGFAQHANPTTEVAPAAGGAVGSIFKGD